MRAVRLTAEVVGSSFDQIDVYASTGSYFDSGSEQLLTVSGSVSASLLLDPNGIVVHCDDTGSNFFIRGANGECMFVTGSAVMSGNPTKTITFIVDDLQDTWPDGRPAGDLYGYIQEIAPNFGDRVSDQFTRTINYGNVAYFNINAQATYPYRFLGWKINQAGVIVSEANTLSLSSINDYSGSNTFYATYELPHNDLSEFEPVYNISPNVSSVNEGGSVTWTITTSNIAPNAVLYYSNAGTSNASDFTDGVNVGSIQLSNNTATLTKTLRNDSSTEGTESIIIQLRTGSTSGTVVKTSATVSIGDTSLTPPPPGPPPPPAPRWKVNFTDNVSGAYLAGNYAGNGSGTPKYSYSYSPSVSTYVKANAYEDFSGTSNITVSTPSGVSCSTSYSSYYDAIRVTCSRSITSDTTDTIVIDGSTVGAPPPPPTTTTTTAAPPPPPNCRSISSVSVGGVSTLGKYQSGTATFTASGLSTDANGNAGIQCYCGVTSQNLNLISVQTTANGCAVNVRDNGYTFSFFTQAANCTVYNSVSGCSAQQFTGQRGISGNTYNAAPDETSIVRP